MTYGAFTQDFAPYEAPRARKPVSQTALCAIILALGTSLGLWALYARPLATPPSDPLPVAAPVHIVTPVQVMPAQVTAAKVAPASIAPVAIVPTALLPKAKKTEARDPALLYPSLTTGYTATTFAQSAPLRSAFDLQPTRLADAAVPAPVAATQPVVPALPESASPIVRDVPLPAPRPSALLAASTKVPSRSGDRQVADIGQPAAPAPAAPQTFFEKMFGGARRSGTALAYAAPDDGGGLGNVGRLGAYDHWTAVYDIVGHTVYLPDGTRLEAHSGLGTSKDNPSSVAERMRGVTPPNLYDLTLRESPFHGVRALRLTPLGGTTYGRAGLLAHTYMLRGHSGESNGCVVFKDYQAFLHAYESGAIRRLAVVARLN